MRSWYKQAQYEEQDADPDADQDYLINIPLNESSYNAFTTEVAKDLFPAPKSGRCPSCGLTGKLGDACQACGSGFRFMDASEDFQGYNENANRTQMSSEIRTMVSEVFGILGVPSTSHRYRISFPQSSSDASFWNNVPAIIVDILCREEDGRRIFIGIGAIRVVFDGANGINEIDLDFAPVYVPEVADDIVKVAYRKSTIIQSILHGLSSNNVAVAKDFASQIVRPV